MAAGAKSMTWAKGLGKGTGTRTLGNVKSLIISLSYNRAANGCAGILRAWSAFNAIGTLFVCIVYVCICRCDLHGSKIIIIFA